MHISETNRHLSTVNQRNPPASLLWRKNNFLHENKQLDYMDITLNLIKKMTPFFSFWCSPECETVEAFDRRRRTSSLQWKTRLAVFQRHISNRTLVCITSHVSSCDKDKKTKVSAFRKPALPRNILISSSIAYLLWNQALVKASSQRATFKRISGSLVTKLKIKVGWILSMLLKCQHYTASAGDIQRKTRYERPWSSAVDLLNRRYWDLLSFKLDCSMTVHKGVNSKDGSRKYTLPSPHQARKEGGSMVRHLLTDLTISGLSHALS